MQIEFFHMYYYIVYMNKKIVKIDIDGVIRDMISAMCTIYNRDFNEHVQPSDVKVYDVDVQFPRIMRERNMSASEYFFKRNCKHITYDIALPYNGVRQAIQKLQQHGYHVVIVSWQESYEAKQHTLHFLHKFHIPYDDICFTRDKYMIHSDYIIDDNPEFLSNIYETAHKILIDAPYNASYECSERYKSLSDAVDNIILNIKKC